MVLLNPVLNCSKRLLLFSVNKVTTATYNVVSVVWNVAFVGEVSLQDKIKDTSQLINEISKVLQKLLRYFNGTTISTSFLPDCLHHKQDY